MHRYKTYNAPMPTTAALAAITTNTTIQTLLQIATPTDRQMQIISWGYTLDDPPGADGVVELLQTDVAATVIAHVASGLYSLDPNAPNSKMVLGTTGTGYTATAEGTITATRVFDVQDLSATSGETPLNYFYQFMPDERPIVAVSKFLRVRITTPTTGSGGARCWVVWDE